MQLVIMRTMPTSTQGLAELHLVGSIDLGTRQQFLDAAFQALASTEKGIVIDAGGIDFVDSVGVSALVELGEMARRHGLTVEISRKSEQLQHVLSLAGVTVDECPV